MQGPKIVHQQASNALATPASTGLESFTIEDFNWHKAPGFGGNGAVIWQAVIKNHTDSYKRSVEVEFTTYDTSGKIIDVDRGFASGLSPGGTAAVKGYATYFGPEHDGRIRIVR